MPRPPKMRRVGFVPLVSYFKPKGIPMEQLAEIKLGIDELEALRLKDILLMDQDKCAEQMNLTQSTFQRILASARQKVSIAIVEGKALRIEGGNYQIVLRWLCRICGHNWEEFWEGDPDIPKAERSLSCPVCNSDQVLPLSHRGNGRWGPPPWAGGNRRGHRGGRGGRG